LYSAKDTNGILILFDSFQRNNMYFMETSAKEADNVEKVFMEIANALIEVIASESFSSPSD